MSSITVSHYFSGNSQGERNDKPVWSVSRLSFISNLYGIKTSGSQCISTSSAPFVSHSLTTASGVQLPIWKASFSTFVLYFGYAVRDSSCHACYFWDRPSRLWDASAWLPFLPSEWLSWFFSSSPNWGSHFGEFKHLRLCRLIRTILMSWIILEDFCLRYLPPSWMRKWTRPALLLSVSTYVGNHTGRSTKLLSPSQNSLPFVSS